MDSDVESTDESDTEKKTKRLEKKLSKQDALYVDDDQMSSEDEGATICPKCKEELSDAGIGKHIIKTLKIHCRICIRCTRTFCYDLDKNTESSFH